MNFIKGTKIPIDKHAKLAYESGHYVEAIQVLHGYLEMRMCEALILISRDYFNSNSEKKDDACNEFSYREITKILWILNYISDEEKDDINALNKVRNEIIHDLFSDDKDISKKKYDQIFKKGIRLVIEMDNKNIDLLG